MLADSVIKLHVILNKDNSVTVYDNNRGIPTQVYIPSKNSHHAGSSYRSSRQRKIWRRNYKVSGGLHGVGASVVNALSEWMEVEVAVMEDIQTTL